uniref:C2H2-type domain-containing protein n=1 Tax=Compsopogon caeruleus TaxID=31354 RepID=A0A7S1XDE2_9RHOD|mmetsp:Transcript_2233/g.3841  ORF Transcript_2233/g.3841 Transcript_2233/m.3841 type:complete len:189 (+) Transcript_2233:70-636(+)
MRDAEPDGECILDKILKGTTPSERKTTLARHGCRNIRPQKYFCSQENCGKGFTSKYNLVCHNRLHSGEFPYKCTQEGCMKDFMWLSSLRSHQRSHERRDARDAQRREVLADLASDSLGWYLTARTSCKTIQEWHRESSSIFKEIDESPEQNVLRSYNTAEVKSPFKTGDVYDCDIENFTEPFSNLFGI